METMKPGRLDWNRVVEGLPPRESSSDPAVPFGFTTRVIARWQAARRDAALQRWARWSLRAALGSVAACMVLAFLAERRETPIVLPLPELPFSSHGSIP